MVSLAEPPYTGARSADKRGCQICHSHGDSGHYATPPHYYLFLRAGHIHSSSPGERGTVDPVDLDVFTSSFRGSVVASTRNRWKTRGIFWCGMKGRAINRLM